MKAMVAKQFGGPEVLALQEVEDPKPAATELLVEVAATSVNPVDYKIREQGGTFGLEAPLILGFDASGVVRETGAEVTGFEPGDDVFYTSEIIGASVVNLTGLPEAHRRLEQGGVRGKIVVRITDDQ